LRKCAGVGGVLVAAAS
jgi:hypothetical protein